MRNGFNRDVALSGSRRQSRAAATQRLIALHFHLASERIPADCSIGMIGGDDHERFRSSDLIAGDHMDAWNGVCGLPFQQFTGKAVVDRLRQSARLKLTLLAGRSH
jgi:hypothetical protein